MRYIYLNVEYLENAIGTCGQTSVSHKNDEKEACPERKLSTISNVSGNNGKTTLENESQQLHSTRP